jgi:hypothetical protein
MVWFSKEYYMMALWFVAVKFLHDCEGNEDEFVNEVMSIGMT